MAKITRGKARSVGLANWSNRFRIMVGFRAVILVLCCFVRLVHLGMCGRRF